MLKQDHKVTELPSFQIHSEDSREWRFKKGFFFVMKHATFFLDITFQCQHY